MAEAATVHRAAFDERLPWLAGRYTLAETTSYFVDHVFQECVVWGAINQTRLLGIIAFREGWIDQLYILPSAQNGGLGATLLNVAKSQQRSLRLWTFRRNARACMFYEKRGFAVIGESEGARNVEREPDVLYEWRIPG